MDNYWFVPGMYYPYWSVGEHMCHNLDADTDMGDLSIQEFHLYFPNARQATAQEVEKYGV